MKKLFFLLVTLLSFYCSFSQTTDCTLTNPTWIQVTSPILLKYKLSVGQERCVSPSYTNVNIVAGPYDADNKVIVSDTVVVITWHLHVGQAFKRGGSYKMDKIDQKIFIVNGTSTVKSISPLSPGDYDFTDTVKISATGLTTYTTNSVSVQVHSSATNGFTYSTFLLDILTNTIPSTLRSTGLIADDPLKVNGVKTYSSKTVARGTSGKRDTQAPTLSIVSPASGSSSTVGSNVFINTSVTDNVGVYGVQLYIDNVLKTTIYPTNCKSCNAGVTWNTTGTTVDNHIASLKSYDAAGNYSNTASISVTINPALASGDVTAPIIASFYLTTASGASAGNVLIPDSSYYLKSNCVVDDSISSIKFYIDGVLTTTHSKVGLYNCVRDSFPYTPTTSSNGTTVLTMRATDKAGNFSEKSFSAIIVLPVVIDTTFGSSFSLASPPVINQGGEGSCVPMSTTYYARSIHEYYTKGASSYVDSINIFSPEYVYNYSLATSPMTINVCGSGSSITYCLDFMTTNGVSVIKKCPYSSFDGCDTLNISAAAKTNAALNKISGCNKVIMSDSLTIKQLLSRKYSLMIGIVTDNSFLSAGPGFIWRTQAGTGVGHAITIVGWDNSKHAWKVVNSWGTGWGDAGYSWIDYDLLPIVGSYYGYFITR
jgi:hypothetical protein